MLSICSLRRTKAELECIYEALEGQRRAAKQRGYIMKWNCIPFGIPKESDDSGVPGERAAMKIDISFAAHPGVVEHLAPIEELPSAALAISVNGAPGPVNNQHRMSRTARVVRVRWLMDMYKRLM